MPIKLRVGPSETPRLAINFDANRLTTLRLSLSEERKASKTSGLNLMTAANFNSGAVALSVVTTLNDHQPGGVTGNDGDRKSPDFRIHDQRNALITVAPDTDIELCGLGVSEVSVVGQAGSAKILASCCTRFISEQSLAPARRCRSSELQYAIPRDKPYPRSLRPPSHTAFKQVDKLRWCHENCGVLS